MDSTGRIVVWYSCGAASAVAAKLTIKDYGASHEIVIARCVVAEEHPDNDRFAADCEKWFGLPIVNLIAEEYGGSVHNVIAKKRYIGNSQGAPCTRLLKKEVRLAFQQPTDTHVFGYCVEERKRFDRFLDSNNIKCLTPLMDYYMTHANCLGFLHEAGLKLPVMYKLGYQHNNCIGCVKSSGAGYWNKIRLDFPAEFDKMAKVSRSLNAKLVKVGTGNSKEKHIFLDELPLGVGNYLTEPEIQCGPWCEAAVASFNGGHK